MQQIDVNPYTHLCMRVLFHRCLYYVFSAPIISDAEYDALERRLAHAEKRKGKRHRKSPTRKVASSLLSDYPRSVQNAAKRCVALNKKLR